MESKMKLRKTKPATKKTRRVREYLETLDEEARTKPNKKRISTVEVTVDYLNALRREVGRHIDPETAEADGVYAEVCNPYGDKLDLPDELQCVGRDYFARSPGSKLWIWFHDLPGATADRLWKKHRHKLAFPVAL
jgi:hypothetical protein